jgi:hypothetical protein
VIERRYQAPGGSARRCEPALGKIMWKRTRRTTEGLIVLILVLNPLPTGCARGPDLRGYDVFGPYTLNFRGTKEQMDNGMKHHSEMRGFIWTHWHEHRRGYVTFTRISFTEGVTCRYTYIIRPTTGGTWQIVERNKCNRPRLSRTEHRLIVSVHRLSSERDRSGKAVIIPDDSPAPAGSFVLRVRDAAGREWEI